MKISEYNSMISELTKPDTRPPEVQKAAEEKRAAAEVNRKNLKRKEYGLPPIEDKKIIDQVVAYSPKKVQGYLPGLEPEKIEKLVDLYDGPPNPDMVKQVKNSVENNKNPGTFKKLVEKDERDFKDKRGERFINKTLKPVERNDNPKGVAFNPTTQLFTNKDRTIAFKTYDEADTWNKAIGITTKPKPYPTQATPEQVGQLAERLERNAQMTGKDGPFTKIAKKPIIKKPFTKKTNYESFKISPILPLSFYKPDPPDPEFIRQEQRFNKMIEENRKPKGLPGILGLRKTDYE